MSIGLDVKINASQLAALTTKFKRWQVITASGFGGLMPAVGELIEQRHKERFSKGAGPAGRWKRNLRGNAPLVLTGALRDSIKARSGRFFTRVSPGNFPYTAIHNFGGTIRAKRGGLLFNINGTRIRAKKSRIPARQYMGLTGADLTKIGLLVNKWVGRFF